VGATVHQAGNWATIMDDAANEACEGQATSRAIIRLPLPELRRVINDDLRTADGSSPTGSECEIYSNIDRPFITVHSRKPKRKQAKRKNISPSNDASLQDNPSKVQRFSDVVRTNVSNQSGAGASTRTNKPLLPSNNNSGRLVRKLDDSKLKAAPNTAVPKSIFCVSNVSREFSCDDIRNHCKTLNLRALFCFDVTASSAIAQALKLAVPSTEDDRCKSMASANDNTSVARCRYDSGSASRGSSLKSPLVT